MVGQSDASMSEPELHGTAGYETPYPYLERLQNKMEERLAHTVPVQGRFCGFCYGRLRAEDSHCPFCEAEVADVGTVDEIPQAVLRAYKTRQATEARWVHMGAFFGLIVASMLFFVLVLWGPGPLGHPAVTLSTLIFGGYLLAQLFGPLIAAQIGYRKGSQKRDAMWAAYVAERDGQKQASREAADR